MLCGLTQRLCEDEARGILAAIPVSLHPVPQPCASHQTTYGLEGFLRRGAAHLDVTPAETWARISRFLEEV